MPPPQYESVADLYDDLLSSSLLPDRKPSGRKLTATVRHSKALLTKWQKLRGFGALLFTTTVSSILLVGNARHWATSSREYSFIIENRATVQLIVQLISNLLGFVHVWIVCLLISYTTRLRISSSAVSLDILHFWNNLRSQNLDWTLPAYLVVVLIVFLALSIVPSALWAGALTPVSTLARQNATMPLPSYSNITLLSSNYTNRFGLPSLQNTKGYFAFNVGESFKGTILSSAAEATTVDGARRQHLKHDFTGFSYNGRSYGIGSTVGLMFPSSATLKQNPLTKYYSYMETGYNPVVNCIYNSTAAFVLEEHETNEANLMYPASGQLPNSNGAAEWSRYIGYSTDSIVAIGVASSSSSVGRILGIAAGRSYANLNRTQCSIDFKPATFNVSVDYIGKNITVTPSASTAIHDIEPTGFMSFLATWQFMLISTDQTSLYSSLVGDSFNTSINNLVTATASNNRTSLLPGEVTLRGLENSISAMIDDILVAYASAQVMVAGETLSTSAIVEIQSFQFGQRLYIISITVLNLLLILVVAVEALRTKAWRGLIDCDYADSRKLILGTVAGLAKEAPDAGLGITMGKMGRYREIELAGNVPMRKPHVIQRETQFVLLSGGTG